jgi:hypothetical protein
MEYKLEKRVEAVGGVRGLTKLNMKLNDDDNNNNNNNNIAFCPKQVGVG